MIWEKEPPETLPCVQHRIVYLFTYTPQLSTNPSRRLTLFVSLLSFCVSLSALFVSSSPLTPQFIVLIALFVSPYLFVYCPNCISRCTTHYLIVYRPYLYLFQPISLCIVLSSICITLSPCVLYLTLFVITLTLGVSPL